MPIIYRRDKGGPLTIEEVDGNFADLDRRLKILETDGIRAEGIARIHQESEIIEITGTRGTVFGRFTLPKVIPKPKGAWKTDTLYTVLDWVHIGRNLYACVAAHRSSVFANDLHAGSWEILVEG